MVKVPHVDNTEFKTATCFSGNNRSKSNNGWDIHKEYVSCCYIIYNGPRFHLYSFKLFVSIMVFLIVMDLWLFSNKYRRHIWMVHIFLAKRKSENNVFERMEFCEDLWNHVDAAVCKTCQRKFWQLKMSQWFLLVFLLCSIKQKPFEFEIWTMHWLTIHWLELNFN